MISILIFSWRNLPFMSFGLFLGLTLHWVNNFSAFWTFGLLYIRHYVMIPARAKVYWWPLFSDNCIFIPFSFGLLGLLFGKPMFSLFFATFVKNQKDPDRPYKDESDKKKKFLSVGNFGILFVIVICTMSTTYSSLFLMWRPDIFSKNIDFYFKLS